MTRFTLFEQPAVLGLLALLPLLAWWTWRGVRRRPAIVLPTAHRLAAIAPSWRVRLRWLPAACLLLGMASLMVALAHPQEGRRQTLIDSEGIAIELVVDRSGSMLAQDFQLDGRPVDRLTAVKRVAGNFLRGDGDQLSGRSADLVGLVTFAGYADAVSPLTLDHAFVIDGLEEITIASGRSEDGTAIGDALGLAVERLQTLDADRDTEGGTNHAAARDKTSSVASKVVILLTDGQNTAGILQPMQGAEIAKAVGIKVYTIGVGTRGMALFPQRDLFTGRTVMRQVQVNIDEDTLTQMAQATGGEYFRATDTDSLAKVYARIDELEKVKLEERTVTDVRDLAVDAWGRLPPILVFAATFLIAALLLENFVFRST
ncbi:MAG: VWA domain-containing protein [Algisphaera sp.]